MSANLKAVLIWMVIFGSWLLLIVLLWGLDTEPAGADDHDYDQQLHQGATVPTDNLDGCTVAELEEACVAIPAAMFRTVRLVADCESKWNPAAVGKLGERGLLQLHPTHRAAMSKAGLDYGQEVDRWKWAVRMWEGNGWRAWSCRPR